MSITEDLTRELRAIPGTRLWPRAPLAPFTTIGVGGRGGLLVSAPTPQAVSAVIATLGAARMPWATLGAGSNLLVADRGFEGVVVKLDQDLAYVESPYPGEGGTARLVVGGATILARLSSVVAQLGLSGLEFACGIPGTVGGGVMMNAGAHGSSMADVVERVQIATADGVVWVDGARIPWSYRASGLPDDVVVTGVVFRLVVGDPDEIRSRQHELLRARGRTQPRGVRTFGSTFKNPPGTSAGRLLDDVGMRGMRRGGAQVSPVHANFITNVEDATAADILALMRMMWEAVRVTFAVELEPEIHLLGAAA